MQAKEEEDDFASQTNYKVSEQAVKDPSKLMEMDKGDEALQRWKAQLLGNANDTSPKNDPRRVVIVEMRIICEGRPGGDIVYAFSTKEQVEKLKDSPFVLKEGCNYKIKLGFKVQHELVTGLKHLHSVTRKGIRVGKEDTMIGSYGPAVKPYEVEIPRRGWEEAPKGMLARGSYKGHSKFVDDDQQVHLEFDYAFAIKKEWGENADKDED